MLVLRVYAQLLEDDGLVITGAVVKQEVEWGGGRGASRGEGSGSERGRGQGRGAGVIVKHEAEGGRGGAGGGGGGAAGVRICGGDGASVEESGGSDGSRQLVCMNAVLKEVATLKRDKLALEKDLDQVETFSQVCFTNHNNASAKWAYHSTDVLRVSGRQGSKLRGCKRS